MNKINHYSFCYPSTLNSFLFNMASTSYSFNYLPITSPSFPEVITTISIFLDEGLAVSIVFTNPFTAKSRPYSKKIIIKIYLE